MALSLRTVAWKFILPVNSPENSEVRSRFSLNLKHLSFNVVVLQWTAQKRANLICARAFSLFSAVPGDVPVCLFSHLE